MTRLYVAFDAGVTSGAFGSGLPLNLGVGYGAVYASVGAATAGTVALLDAALEGYSSIYLRHTLGSGPLWRAPR
jgi:hypothetical protein